MRGNGGVGRPGHVGGELRGTLARKNGSELGNAALPTPDNGQGGDAGVEEAGEAFGGLAWPETGRRARAESLTRGGARRGRNGEERERWGGE